jgi:YD repeat-containing protein
VFGLFVFAYGAISECPVSLGARKVRLDSGMKTRTTSNEDGSKTVYVYNAHEHHVRTTDYDANGRITCDIYYDTDEEGQSIGWQVYKDDGTLRYRFEIERDAEGYETTRQYTADGTLELITVETRDGDGNLVYRNYDANGQLINR